MSVICSALQWVLDRQQQQQENAAAFVGGNGQGSDDEPDWMRDFVVNTKDQQFKENKVKNKKEKIRSVFGKSDSECNHNSTDKLKKKIDAVNDESEEEFLLEEYESEDENGMGSVASKRKASKSNFTSSSEDESGDDGEEEEEEKTVKVYFCSRTHSQLSQFVKELQKTVFANEMSVVSLGSRKNLCINQGLEILLQLEGFF